MRILRKEMKYTNENPSGVMIAELYFYPPTILITQFSSICFMCNIIKKNAYYSEIVNVKSKLIKNIMFFNFKNKL